jgi:hypothetical protein
MIPDKELALLELMNKLLAFEVRLKEIELLADNLETLKRQVDLLTLSMEAFVTIVEPQKEKKNGNSVSEDVLQAP